MLLVEVQTVYAYRATKMQLHIAWPYTSTQMPGCLIKGLYPCQGYKHLSQVLHVKKSAYTCRLTVTS